MQEKPVALKESRPEKIPKYIQIAESIRRDIERGVMAPGDRLPSFAEMRTQMGIGQGTLERVHSLLEKDNLIVREPNRGVFVARPGRRGSGLIAMGGIYSQSSRSPYLAQLIQGMQSGLAGSRFDVVMLNENYDRGWQRFDGILHWRADDLLSELPPYLPSVSLLVPKAGFNSVAADDAAGMAAATRHLLELGHQRIALLITKVPSFHAPRLAGYRRALQEAGIEPEPGWVRKLNYDAGLRYRGSGYADMCRWLQEDWDKLSCTAVLAQNDETAIGVIQALQQAGLQVPQQISVVGFDGVEAAEYFSPRLTTVRVPLREIGEAGARLLLQRMEEPDLPVENQLMPVTLQPGDSTARASTARAS